VIPLKRYSLNKAQKCSRCGKVHLGECRRANHTCFRCGKPGHFILDCLVKPNDGNLASGSGQRRPKAQGRVFALTEQDAEASPEVIIGTLNICSKSAYV
jgi:ribosomal protein L32